jgi:hypothetical protein
MGMFDWLICKVPLPRHIDPRGREFQTKDFQEHPQCERLVITRRGELRHSWVDSYDKEKGATWTVPAKTNFTGVLFFYDFYTRGYKSPQSKEFHWVRERGLVEFKATFREGLMFRLSAVEVRKV